MVTKYKIIKYKIDYPNVFSFNFSQNLLFNIQKLVGAYSFGLWT